VTAVAWALLVPAIAVALVDWYAVATERRDLEYVAKPLTMVLLIGVALTLTPADPTMRTWFVAALVLSLAGDVFLMLPAEKLFVAGLGSFLVGHVAYVVGFAAGGLSGGRLLVGAVLTGTAMLAVGPTIIKGAKDVDPMLAVPVFLYIAVISVMVAVAIGSGVTIAVVGAVLFYLSDTCIGWSRFVQPFEWSRLAIITTYHLGQLFLVLSLVVAR